MTLVLLMGLQASGKTAFQKERYGAPYLVIRPNGIDSFGLRCNAQAPNGKELAAALAAGCDIVVDHTNSTRNERAHYLGAAQEAGYHTIGYYFRSDFKESLARNAVRPAAERVPVQVMKATLKKFERPAWEEGFDELYYVYLDRAERFVVDGYRRAPE